MHEPGSRVDAGQGSRDGQSPADGSAGIVAVFSGGGSGGHLYPALAIADALQHIRPDVHPVFVGAQRGIEARVLPARNVEYHLFPIRGIHRGRGLANWRLVPGLVSSLIGVGRLFRRVRPALVVVTGGYAGGPAGAMAALMGIPLVLQEANTIPGLTTRLLSQVAREIHVAFPEAIPRLPRWAQMRAHVTGNPIRPPFDVPREEARLAFGLRPEGTVVLVVGGSQGAKAINEFLTEALIRTDGGELARPEGLQLLWATGPTHEEAVRAALAASGVPDWVRVQGYIDDMPTAMAAADVVLGRASAMVTSEAQAWGLPMLLVPLPTAAADHQARNAEALSGAGAALHLVEADLDATGLWDAIVTLVESRERRAEMGQRARERGRPDAAADIARCLARLLPPGAAEAASEAPGNDPARPHMGTWGPGQTLLAQREGAR